MCCGNKAGTGKACFSYWPIVTKAGRNDDDGLKNFKIVKFLGSNNLGDLMLMRTHGGGPSK